MRRALLGAGVAALVQRLGVRGLPGGPQPWERTNFRGVTVSSVAGPALALGLAAAGPAPYAVAALGAGACGLYDDVAGLRAQERGAKGLRGHVGALRRGQVTGGAVKVVGIGATGLVASALLGPRPVVDVLLDAAVVAGAANALNLLDLRPGRALKAGLATAAVTRQPAPGLAAAVLLPADLGERTMLGDTGANALGAVLGLGYAARTPQRGRRARALLGLVALTAASEAVSFSRVLDAVPPLRLLDRLGRAA